jgi:carboxymethylenebutenolidase
MGSTVQIEAADGGQFEAYIAAPRSGAGPGLIVLPEMFNVNSTVRQVADDYAAKGFIALAPDMYWRTEPRSYLEYSRENSPRGRTLYNALNRDLAVEDVGQCIAYLRTNPGGNGKVGLVGFCMGGEVGLLVGCRLRIDAIAIYYGTQMLSHVDEMASVAPPTMMHFAELDPHVPLDSVRTIQQKLAGLSYVEIFIYEGVDHAFARPNHPLFDAAAAELADERTMELFKPLF